MEVEAVSEHTNELQDRFSDAAIALMMDQYAQEDGNALLQRYQEVADTMPELLDRHCQRVIQNAHKRTLMRSTLKRAARAAACVFLILTLTCPFAMSVEAIRIPVLNFMLKHGKGFTEITFSQDTDSFSALDQLRTLIWMSIPEGYQFDIENVHTSKFRGTETVSSLLVRYEDNQKDILEISILKAKGSINIDSQDSVVTPMDLYGQQAVFVADEEELRVLWVNESQGQLYSVIGYGTEPDTFWECVHTLSKATQNTQENITF